MPGTKEGARNSAWIRFCQANRDYRKRDADLLSKLAKRLTEQGYTCNDSAPILRIVRDLLAGDAGRPLLH